ncbi:MAG TPA: hypothetical protein VF223_10210 [Trebonia sp.]
MKVTDAMHPFGVPLPVKANGSSARGDLAADVAAVAGPVTRQLDPQAVFAGESLGQALRQLEVYGRDGLPVISGDGQRIQGWVTNASVLQALARQLSTARVETARAQLAADWGHQDLESSLREPSAPLHGYQVAEISIGNGSPATGQRIDLVAWPAGCIPVSVLRASRLRPAGPAVVLRPGDRVSLLVPAPGRSGGTGDGASASAGGAAPVLSSSAADAGKRPDPEDDQDDGEGTRPGQTEGKAPRRAAETPPGSL